MTARFRTMLGVALFVPLAGLLLGIFACLPAPVGDPETSKVDEQYVGAYKGVADKGGPGLALALLRPWDGKTYLLDYLVTDTKEGKETHEAMHFKAWLTKIADHTFITAQPMDDLRFVVGDVGAKPYWVVLRLDNTPAGLEARMVNPDSAFLKDLTKREEFEAAIKAHATDKALYTEEPIVFKKLGKEDQTFLEETLAKFGISTTNGPK